MVRSGKLFRLPKAAKLALLSGRPRLLEFICSGRKEPTLAKLERVAGKLTEFLPA
jgi:hypothetical protein